MATRKKAKQRKPHVPSEARRAVLVVGPPRAGTSVVAHMLSKLGVYFGKERDFVDPSVHTHNPIFFELQRLNELNEQVLREIGHEYADFDFFPGPNDAWDYFSKDLQAEARNLIRDQLDNRALIGLKDPRFCFTLPFWTRILAELGYTMSFVWAIRSTEPTIRSNTLVNQQSLSYSARVTMLSLGASAMHLRNLSPRINVDYDDIVSNPTAMARRLAKWLGGDVNIEEAASVVKAELRGQAAKNTTTADPIELDEQADGYLAFRKEMERKGVLHLLLQRQRKAAAVDEQEKQDYRHHLSEAATLLHSLRPVASGATPSAAKIYWRRHEEQHCEERSSACDIQSSDGTFRVRFAIPEDVSIEYLRFDPDSLPGVFSISRVKMNGVEIPDPEQMVSYFSQYRMPAYGNELIRFASLSDDPHIEFDVRAFAADGVSELEVDYRRVSVLALVDDMERKVESSAALQVAELREQRTLIEESLKLGAEQQARMERDSARVREYDLLISRQSEQLAEQQAMLVRATSQLDEQSVVIQGQSDQLEELRQSADRHAARVEECRLLISRHSEQLAEQQSMLDQRMTASEDGQREQMLRMDMILGELSNDRRALASFQNGLSSQLKSFQEEVSHRLQDQLGSIAEQADSIGAGLRALREELYVLREDQRLLKAWAQRRSPRYWWRRWMKLLAPGRQRVSLAVDALANVHQVASGEGRETWQAHNEDPQLILRRTDSSAPIPAGWYRLRVRLLAVDGAVIYPCAYADFGDGFSDESRVVLPMPNEDGWIDTVVMFRQPVRQLRFDPTTCPAVLSLQGLRLDSIGRWKAMSHMLRAVSRAEGCRKFLNVLARMVATLPDGGLRRAGDLLRARHVASLNVPIDEYSVWIQQFDRRDEASHARWSERLRQLPRTPLISILLPTYNTPEKWLRRALDSVMGQVYPHWELCIADDASTKPRVRRVLREYAAKDARIRVVYRDHNGHISAASNSALETATGEFVALLDHDDELSPHALLEIVEAICAHPKWQMVYSDEDKIDEYGRRYDPYFKPDWNRELLLGQNCISHLGVYRTDLVREVGGFREGFEGSQDWDLALRISGRLADDQVGHVPQVLYHWRAIRGSTALGVDEKNYAVDAGRRAVQEHLQQTGQPARVDVLQGGQLRVVRKLESTPLVSLVIPTRDKVDLLRTCVQSILEKTGYRCYEILVVDNRSTDPRTHTYLASLANDPRVRVLRNDAPFNYSFINNFAVSQARGEIIGLVNNDIEVISGDWLQVLVGQAVRPGVGAVGAMLLYPDDTIQHAGVVTGIHGIAGHLYVERRADYPGYFGRALLDQEMSAVTAACLLVRRAVFEEVGGLDEELPVAFNDVDFCLRVRDAGYRNIWTPQAVLYHHESATRGHEDTPEKQARFEREVAFMRRRWGKALTLDPAYNPNLSLAAEPFSLAFPPR